MVFNTPISGLLQIFVFSTIFVLNSIGYWSFTQIVTHFGTRQELVPVGNYKDARWNISRQKIAINMSNKAPNLKYDNIIQFEFYLYNGQLR